MEDVMKKQICAVALATAFSMPSMADVLDVYVGLDYHSTSTETSDNETFEDSENFSGYVAVEHLIPLIPNAKIKYSDLDSESLSIDRSSSLASAIAYYELFDNGLFEFDLGLAVTQVSPAFGSSTELVQAYAAAKAYVPGINMYGFAEVLAGTVSDDEATDAEIGLAYTFNPNSVIPSLTIRTGYRYQEMVTQKTQENKGAFAGVELHF